MPFQDYGDYNYNSAVDGIDYNSAVNDLANNVVVHSHRIDWVPNDIENFNLIISLRRNKLLQTLSAMVAMETGQNTNYPKKLESNSIHIDPDKFLGKLYSLNTGYNKLLGIVNKGWLSVRAIYYGDPLDINLDLPDILDDYYVEKSNIDYKQVVSNYHELKLIYDGSNFEWKNYETS